MNNWREGIPPHSVPVEVECFVDYFGTQTTHVFQIYWHSYKGVCHYDEHEGIGCNWKDWSWKNIGRWRLI